LKRLFFLVCLAIVLGALAFFLLDEVLYALVSAVLFALWFLYYQVADYQFIEFSDENEKILLRYYKVIHFGKTNYNSIEFPQHIMYKAQFEDSFFGKMSDLTLIVKTSRGIAEYPTVSLSALSKEQRRKMQEALFRLTGHY
jgi:hypothetical protein